MQLQTAAGTRKERGTQHGAKRKRPSPSFRASPRICLTDTAVLRLKMFDKLFPPRPALGTCWRFWRVTTRPLKERPTPRSLQIARTGLAFLLRRRRAISQRPPYSHSRRRFDRLPWQSITSAIDYQMLAPAFGACKRPAEKLSAGLRHDGHCRASAQSSAAGSGLLSGASSAEAFRQACAILAPWSR